FHLPTFEEMQEKFSQYPNAISNTKKIADRCHLNIDTKSVHMPNFLTASNETENECLIRLSHAGLLARKPAIQQWRAEGFTENVWKEYEERLEHELTVILQMNF